MSTLKSKDERLARNIRVNMREEEYANVERLAERRKLQIGPCVRAILKDYLRTQLSRESTLILEAIAEVKANHLDVVEQSLTKQLTTKTLQETADSNRLRRRALLHEFLGTIPARETTPENDNEDDEEYDEEED